ncbi:hypothetical protein EG329_000983 [Mollisiaceae sp. DMI_Dod_QoI]|nr:hypothetical protein EG329_000983 [Helotiales sp. DMI_Dod_QoI]
MGLFKHRDKARSDAVSETPSSNPTSAVGPPPQHQHNNSYHDSAYYSNSNASSADAGMSPGPSQPPPQRQSQPPGTTVTTTTTTTTIAPDGTTYTHSAPYNPSTDPPPQASETTVNKSFPTNAATNAGISQNPSPNPTQSQQHTYNQAPPTIKQTAPTPDQSQSAFQPPSRKLTPKQTQPQYAAPPPPGTLQPQHSGNQAYNQPVNNQPSYQAYSRPEDDVPLAGLYRTNSGTTSGGRPIPARSEFRTSPGHSPGTPSPINTQAPSANSLPMPMRSEKRNSREHIVAPLNTHPVSELPAHSPYGEHFGSPTTPTNSSRPKTPNFSRPGIHSPSNSMTNIPQYNMGNTTTVSAGSSPVATTAETVPPKDHKLERKKGSVTAALKGFHGAGEALRGQVNSTIARGMHDTAEEERMRAVRDKGMGEWRGSGLSERVPVGLREGFREKAGDRLRSRRLSQGNMVHGSEGPNGLDPVEERSIEGLNMR